MRVSQAADKPVLMLTPSTFMSYIKNTNSSRWKSDTFSHSTVSEQRITILCKLEQYGHFIEMITLLLLANND